MKICHFSSVHRIDDVRVFVKECKSLASAGHEVYLIACGNGNENMIDGVHIIGMENLPKSRFKRMTFFSRRVFRTAVGLDCDIYHFHDPELLRYGKKLKKLGKKVIFDSHEDIPAQIMDKQWIPMVIRGAIAFVYRKYESLAVKKIDAVVTATPYIAEQFEGRAKRVTIINNYPRLDDIECSETPFIKRDAYICYAGGISELRGEKTMIQAMHDVKGCLIIAGDHEQMVINDHVKYVGRLDRKGINSLYGKSVLGLCVLKPISNYYYSQPIKMYEYMAAGIPFICSDFPLWEKVVKDSKAGFVVNPDDSKELASKINYLLNNRELAQKMGENGRKYMLEHCNWDKEEKKLLKLYETISVRA